MKPSFIIQFAALGIAITTGAGAAEAFQKREVRLQEAPQAVQAAIAEHSRGGKFDELEKVRFEGRTIYIAEIDLPGDRDLDLYFSEDGALKKSVEEITMADAPEAVRRAVESIAAKGGKVDDIDKVSSGGTVTFQVEIERPGPDLHLVVSMEGEILGQMDEVDD